MNSIKTILTVFAGVATVIGLPAVAAPAVEVASPDGNVRLRVFVGSDARLSYAFTMRGKPVIEASPMGIIVDGVDLGAGVRTGAVERYRIRETYRWRGVHSRAVNHANGARVSVRSAKAGAGFNLDVRVFNDGAAFRYVVPGEGRRAPDEATLFRIPAGSTVWYHDFNGHYEGIHAKKKIDEVKAGEWAAPPLTFKLPGNAGYGSITEGGLVAYSGMGLQADGRLGFAARLGHAHPVSYPFRLRYAEDVNRLAVPAAITGTITTPWRIVMAGPDLNTLVNCDIVHNVAPPPDPKLFPKGFDTAWLRPGRSVWRYLDGGENTLAGMKEFSRLAAELGFEYNLLEGFWQKWSDAELRELVDYSRQRNVGILLWKHNKQIRNPEERRAFFRKCREAGVAGVKLDFFDHEAKEVIDLYHAALREAAEFQLIVDFHGANKPAGESRTWPNEMTREGIYGLEHRRTAAWGPVNTTLPFTRMLAGHADYTPVHFGERRRETSWVHQIASAAIFTSPLLVYGAHPKSLIENPGVEIIKSIPSVWDETIALPPSEIGEVAAFARRNGGRWFVAVMNGAEARTIQIALFFLGGGKYRGLLLRDDESNPAALKKEEITASRGDTLTVSMRAGGGFIARFDK